MGGLEVFIFIVQGQNLSQLQSGITFKTSNVVILKKSKDPTQGPESYVYYNICVYITSVQSDGSYGIYMCSLTPPVLSRRCSQQDDCHPHSLLACFYGRCCARNIYALGILQKGLEVLRCRKLIERNPCKPDPCPPGVKCLTARKRGRSKAVCIQDDPCLEIDCGINGDCISSTNNGTRTARCLCNPGFCGDICTQSPELTGDLCPDGICTVPGSICVNGACACDCGDVYIAETVVDGGSSSRRVCRAGCPNGIANTFTDFPASQLLSDNALPITNIPTLDECKTECLNSATFECVSIEYVTNAGVCILNKVRKDDPTAFVETPNAPFLIYSERNCS